MNITKNIDKAKFAKRLKLCRLGHRRSFSVSQIAKHIGVHRNTYTKWEDSDRPELPSDLNVFAKMCDYLEVSATYLITGNEDWTLNVDRIYRDRIKGIYNKYITDKNFSFVVQAVYHADDDVVKSIADLFYNLNRNYRALSEDDDF